MLGSVGWGGVGCCGVLCGLISTGPRNKTNRTWTSVALDTAIMSCRSTNHLHVCSETIFFNASDAKSGFPNTPECRHVVEFPNRFLCACASSVC